MEKLRQEVSHIINKITGGLPEDYHFAMLGLEKGIE
jgi:hypothetical protein